MTGIKDRATLKSYFENGDMPDETHFEELIDSSVGKIVVITPYSETLVTDLTKGHVFTITITGNIEISNPTGGIDGNSYTWRIKQGGSGDHVITLGSKFKIPSSATTPLGWSTNAGAMDIFIAQYDSSEDLFYVLSMIPGY